MNELRYVDRGIMCGAHLMSFANKVGTKHINMVFDSPNIWVEEVRYHTAEIELV